MMTLEEMQAKRNTTIHFLEVPLWEIAMLLRKAADQARLPAVQEPIVRPEDVPAWAKDPAKHGRISVAKVKR
jgi:hypothetical protein